MESDFISQQSEGIGLYTEAQNAYGLIQSQPSREAIVRRPQHLL